MYMQLYVYSTFWIIHTQVSKLTRYPEIDIEQGLELLGCSHHRSLSEHGRGTPGCSHPTPKLVELLGHPFFDAGLTWLVNDQPLISSLTIIATIGWVWLPALFLVMTQLAMWTSHAHRLELAQEAVVLRRRESGLCHRAGTSEPPVISSDGLYYYISCIFHYYISTDLYVMFWCFLSICSIDLLTFILCYSPRYR